MPLVFRHAPVRAAALAAAVLVAACSGRTTSGDDALKRDLDVAKGDGLALAPRGSQTQVVSALELGNAGKATPTGAPAHATTGTPAAPQRLAARAPVAAPRVRIIERIVYRHPEPSHEVAAAPEPAPASTRAPEPAPVASEPVPVAAPSPGSRHLPTTTDEPGRGRRGRGTWDMGDVIRNAPFPINPLGF